MAQSWRVKAERPKGPRPPLDEEGLERLALFYVGRFGTTRAKLAFYLRRKLRERGWSGSGEPDPGALVERIAGLGYIDDGAFAVARAASLQRRGFGERRVDQALHAAGIGEADGTQAREQARAGALAAALRFAERKRIGPFAAGPLDRDEKQKAFAAMMRAGHPMGLVRKVLDAGPGEIPECDTL
jgi:regulatory protein